MTARLLMSEIISYVLKEIIDHALVLGETGTDLYTFGENLSTHLLSRYPSSPNQLLSFSICISSLCLGTAIFAYKWDLW